ncbi:MAG TPA: ABC transporter permease, partial [Citreicella sp.]|nr:ABC transporter permease [Citreicella sp.]
GMTGMVPPFKTSCANHTGHSGGWILEWDGAKFVKATDLIMPDAEAIAPLEAQAAKDYAEANAPWPANDACQM